MDTFTLYGLTNELADKIIGARINKIYHIDNFYLKFQLSNGNNFIISVNPYISALFIFNDKLYNPAKPSTFCMLLRKYLGNGHITHIESIKFYRIVNITVQKKESFILSLNLSGKANNIILKNKANRILYNFKGFKEVIPEKPPFLHLTEFKNNLKCNTLSGFPPFVIKEFKFLSEDDVYNLYKKLYNYDCRFKPIKIGNKIYPFLPKHLNFKEYQRLHSFDEFFKSLFTMIFFENKKKEIRKLLQNKIKKLNKTLKNIDAEIDNKKNFEQIFKTGELLKMNIHNIKKGMESIKVTDYFDKNIQQVEIHLKKDKSPVENIEYYFKRAKKAKRGMDKLVERKKIIKRELDYFSENMYFAENLDNIAEIEESFYNMKIDKNNKKITKKTESIQNYRVNDFNNIKIYSGKSSKGNDFILKKFGQPEFIWLHIKDFPGSHVIIAEKQSKITNDILMFAAKIALENSKAKENGKGEVIYTPVKYVNKIKNAPAGMVSVKKFKTVFVKL